MAKNLTLKTAASTFNNMVDMHIKTAGGNKKISSAWIKTATGNKQIWPNFAFDASTWDDYRMTFSDEGQEGYVADASVRFTLDNTADIVVRNFAEPIVNHSISWRDGTGTLLTGDAGGRLTSPVACGGSGPKYIYFTDSWRAAGIDDDVWVYIRRTTDDESATVSDFNPSNLNTWLRLNITRNLTASVEADNDPEEVNYMIGRLHFNFARTGATMPTWTPDPDITVTIPDGSFRYNISAHSYGF